MRINSFLRGFAAIVLLWIAPGHATAEDYIGQGLEPLEQMAEGETRRWIWAQIHKRCAGLYLVLQTVAVDDPAVTNTYIDDGERHAHLAARYLSESVELDEMAALVESIDGANALGSVYLALAEQHMETGGKPLDQPLIESDLRFCEKFKIRSF